MFRPYQPSSPGPLERLYGGENGYMNANSPQPNGFQALAMNRVYTFYNYQNKYFCFNDEINIVNFTDTLYKRCFEINKFLKRIFLLYLKYLIILIAYYLIPLIFQI